MPVVRPAHTSSSTGLARVSCELNIAERCWRSLHIVVKMPRLITLAALLGSAAAWNNGAALTPPMSWANWNLFGCDYNDTTFREMADAMVSTGLAGLGYSYLLVQECITPLGSRDSQGRQVVDATKFPYGMADLFSYFHSKGLKAGIYTDVKYKTCAGYEGSGPGPGNPAGHWPIDALTFAQWGVDMIEADFCNQDALNLTAYQLYKSARDAIAAASEAVGRPITFYICNWGAEDPWLWAPEVGNMFRATSDICGPGSIAWSKILYNFDNTIIHTNTPPAAPGLPGTGIGAWVDADMLGTGMPGISDVEGRSQFSLWCILGNPLTLAADLRNLSAATLATISNAEAIAINQDPLGIQGYAVDATPLPTEYNGGVLLNFTSTCTPGQSGTPVTGSAWQLLPDGHVCNNNTGDCITIYSCDNTPGSLVFAYAAVNNTCLNELWTYSAASGLITSNVIPAPPSPLCLTAVDPATNPFSQLIVDTCDASRNDQKWALGADGTLSVQLSGSSGSALCLEELASSGTLYAKPLSPAIGPGSSQKIPTQGIAVAVLNRGAADLPSYTVDLSLFSFAPAQQVLVRDIWAGQTLGPFAGNFTTRPIASHETLLLRVYLA